MANFAPVNPEVIIWARRYHNLTHAELAEKVDIHVNQIQNWEDGKTKPTFNQAKKLASVLHLPFGYLFLSEPPALETPLPDLRTRHDHATEVSPNKGEGGNSRPTICSPSPQKFRTIVADPPWEQQGTYAVTRGFRVRVPSRREIEIPYPTMPIDEICALPVGELAEKDAHLYLWTTQQFLHESFHVIEAWGFRVAATLVWCKKPHAIQIGGAFGSSVEFCHFARRGNLATIGKINRRWFEWPRKRGAPVKMGQRRNNQHSAKPEAFQDIVESVSPGPYLELFARRTRLGWSTWGNEALCHVELKTANG